jgi:hypothetical protein
MSRNEEYEKEYQRFRELRFATYRQAWEGARDYSSLWKTVDHCADDARPLPRWAVDALRDVLFGLSGSEPERKRWLRDHKHTWRWARVKEFRQLPRAEFDARFHTKKTWENTWAAVAELEADEESVFAYISDARLHEALDDLFQQQGKKFSQLTFEEFTVLAEAAEAKVGWVDVKPAPVTVGTIKASYRLVERDLKAGTRGRFAALFYAPGDQNWVKK